MPAMSEDPGDRRPLRYRSVHIPEHEHPSVGVSLLLSVIALVVTLFALIVVSHPDPDNIPGDVIVTAILVPLAGWVDWHVMRRWEEIVTTRRGRGPNPD